MIKAPKPKTQDPAPKGNHIARLFQIVHIGTIPDTYKGEPKETDTIRLAFELCNKTKVFKEGEEARPYSISEKYTFSMGKKANLRKMVEGILGEPMTDKEAYDFDIESLLGKACLLSVIHQEGRDGNLYANIQSASPLPEGITAPAIHNTAKLIDVNQASREEIDALPDFIKEKMQTSAEYGRRFLGVVDKTELESLEEIAPAQTPDEVYDALGEAVPAPGAPAPVDPKAYRPAVAKEPKRDEGEVSAGEEPTIV